MSKRDDSRMRGKSMLAWSGDEDRVKDFRNQFILGDSLEVMRKIPSESIDLVVTSPPYN